MHAIATKEERKNKAVEESGLLEEAKIKALEEAEPDNYCKLRSPCEDIYSETLYDTPVKRKAGKQTEGKTRLYRAACISLTILCLVLLLIIIILYVLIQPGSTVCPGRVETAAEDTKLDLPPTCSPEECRAHFPIPTSQRWQCEHCPDGWLKFGQWCFFLSTFRLSWDESWRNCSTKGGSLAVIGSRTVQDFLTNKGSVNYWTGLRRNGDMWTWPGNIVLKTSYWADAPLNGDCVILRGGNSPEKNWIRAPCQAYTYFICQLQL
ncbi:early activation antigen CD69 [Brachionichthys hirsutus]|uniref:early activation antigen CD69 n=1 Tax=Brachionichthys hirsutus TaxID=412623 RepID=UPI00360473FD